MPLGLWNNCSNMHAIKGGWVGQTFAMATSADFGGKKARIRRSKEERKAMVKSFIERYQKSNNGNFPSLNLTHKEVGGSFYIVREIVREIIQENRILGPGILSAEEQNDYSFLEQYPLGSISTEPQIQMLTSQESHVMLNESTIEDSSSNLKFYEHEDQRAKDGSVHNGNPGAFEQECDGSSTTLPTPIDESIIAKKLPNYSEQMPGLMTEQFINEDTVTLHEENIQEEDSDEQVSDNALPIHHEGTSVDQLQSSIEQLPGSEVEISTSEDIARGSSQQSFKYQDCNGRGQEKAQVQESLVNIRDGANEQEVLIAGESQMTTDAAVETFPLRPLSKVIHSGDERSGEPHEISGHLEEKTEEDRVNSLDGDSVSTDEKSQAAEEVLRLEAKKPMVDDKAVLASPTESLNGSSMKKDMAGLSKASLAAREKPVNYPNGLYPEHRDASSTVISPEELKPLEATSTKNTPNVQHDGSPNGSNPTLNRINLEKWEGKSRNSAGSETNPLLALFKAFVTAFVRFWTE